MAAATRSRGWRGPVLAYVFLLELLMLAALALAGWELGRELWLRVLIALVLVVAAVVCWALWFSPRARRRLRAPWLWLAEAVIFLVTAGLLVLSGWALWALGFAVLAALALAGEVAVSRS